MTTPPGEVVRNGAKRRKSSTSPKMKVWGRQRGYVSPELPIALLLWLMLWSVVILYASENFKHPTVIYVSLAALIAIAAPFVIVLLLFIADEFDTWMYRQLLDAVRREYGNVECRLLPRTRVLLIERDTRRIRHTLSADECQKIGGWRFRYWKRFWPKSEDQ